MSDQKVKLSELYEQYKKMVEENNNIIYSKSNDEQLQLYSCFKQAEFGDCNEEPEPIGLFNSLSYDVRKKNAKIEMWKKLNGKSTNEAKKMYIKKAKELLNFD